MRTTILVSLLALAGCTAADVQAPQPLAEESTEVWSWAASNEILREASCPRGHGYLPAGDIEIEIIDAERGSDAAHEQNLTGLTLAGAWQLKSDEPNFGGLSGLDILPSGELLAITDAGAFVWIGIDGETGHPDGKGWIAFMRNEGGDYFQAKVDADSEGLTYRDGLALVSFEQDHRVEAFDIENCGAGARAAQVVALDTVLDGRVLGDNRGPEALTLSGDTLLAGFEMHQSGGSPIASVQADGALMLQRYTSQPFTYLMTGMDQAYGLTASLFRAYDPVRGARVILQVDDTEGRRADAHFKQPLPVDNFEGVAIGKNPSGNTRIWVISDDNFSRNQRTLLLALDLEP